MRPSAERIGGRADHSETWKVEIPKMLKGGVDNEKNRLNRGGDGQRLTSEAVDRFFWCNIYLSKYLFRKRSLTGS
ncbi:hypothetical protein VF12_40590 [Nostoc linckia z15]|nr:hypothetical protein VF12_40590 [Nostoc linckia z15]